MSQNTGPFLVSSHGPTGFNPRLPASASSPLLKRTTNGPLSLGNSPNTSVGTNMNISSASPMIPMMRTSNSMGTLKSANISMNPMDKSSSMPYPSRYTRKVWPISRNIHDKNIRGYDDHESPYARPGIPNHPIPPDNMGGSSFTIEPAIDDDEGDDIIFSSRHMAAARFQRNQRLLYEIFNEVCIPDLRSNVSVDRISTLRRQVDALKTHRETFEKDLHDLEEKHVEKKRKLLESDEKFHKQYTEASSKDLSQEKINEILQKHEAIDKLQKEKQPLLQQQQTVATVSQPTGSTTPKVEPMSTTDVPHQQTPLSSVQSSVPPAQPTNSASTPSVTPSQSVPSHLPPSQSATTQLPPPQSVPSQIPSSQAVQLQTPSSQSIPPAQPTQPPIPPPQSIHSPMVSSQPIQSSMPSSQPLQFPMVVTTAAPPSSSAPTMSQMPPHQQQPQPTSVAQGYPMMHPVSGYPTPPQQVSGYGHPQQTPYRPPMNQRTAQYPPNMQWQQQPQQWQPNTYDSRYYNPYPANVQWSQQQQQQQPPPHMRGPPHSQQSSMYPNSVHYGYSGAPAGWNPNTHPPQQYGYPQNPSYDPSMISAQSAPPPQQYYSSPQMHNAPQGYDYGPPQQQSQQQMPPQ